jgi:glycosyltransferase involved in cell wall biosynthesis
VHVAIVAPAPVPYTRGGAETHWASLRDHLERATHHHAEIVELPSREHEFWDLVDSYRAFAELDVSRFDAVITGKYPAWMVEHPRHVCHVLHRLRGLYDTYHYFGLPETVPASGASGVPELLAFMDAHAGERLALPEFFGRMDALREARLPAELTAFPGPFVRAIVHWLDGIGMAPERIARFGAISQTVRDRPGYFPDGADVFVVYPTSEIAAALRGVRGHLRRPYLFTVSRLDGPKRIDLLIEAMRHVKARDVALRIAGTGPQEERLRRLAAEDERISFCGYVDEAELLRLYAGARGVVFLPHDEDFGLVTIEAMCAARPVITCADAGGPLEIVEDGVTGWVVEPDAAALAGAIDRLWSTPALVRARMGRVARRRSRAIEWTPLVRELEALE